jgi:hypothetical protein
VSSIFLVNFDFFQSPSKPNQKDIEGANQQMYIISDGTRKPPYIFGSPPHQGDETTTAFPSSPNFSAHHLPRRGTRGPVLARADLFIPW